MVEFLLTPNVAYLLLVAGFFFAILALFAPGTGILEVAALLTLVLAGWEVYNLPINLWALIVLLMGVFPFLLALRRSQRLVFLMVSILTLVVGSAFLFRGEGWLPAVNPFLALVVSAMVSGFLWILTTKTLEASQVRPEHDLAKLDGAVGEAKTEINHEGSVQVAGELWTARSDKHIPAGAKVHVIGREGLVLVVEVLE